MKKIKIYLLSMFLIFSAGLVMAQADDNDRKSRKEERKQLRKEKNEKQAKELLSLVNDKYFVLEAHGLYNRYNSRINVSPNTNFISVIGDALTIQTAGGFSPGFNGLGGITINGTITGYEVKKSKKDISIIIQYSSVVMGYSTLTVNISRDGSARALITDNWGRRVTYHGNIVSPEESIVYKGMAI